MSTVGVAAQRIVVATSPAQQESLLTSFCCTSNVTPSGGRSPDEGPALLDSIYSGQALARQPAAIDGDDGTGNIGAGR